MLQLALYLENLQLLATFVVFGIVKGDFTVVNLDLKFNKINSVLSNMLDYFDVLFVKNINVPLNIVD